MTAPRLGLVTICRNALPALQRTVESVLPQLPPEVDYAIVRWLSEPDRGISDAMNKGARFVRGTWIAHLHADDTYLEGAVARMLAEIAADDADVLCGWMLKAEDAGDVLCRCDPERLPWDMTVNHPATLVRRDWFERLNGFELTLENAMDYDFFLRAKLAGARFRVVPMALTRFAAGGQSERSLWRTLHETHEIRRRRLRSGPSRSSGYLAALWFKGTVRIALQRMGLTRLVAAYRRHVAYPPKG